MTTANKITVGRILLAPVFIGFTLYYIRTGTSGFHVAALAAFAVAAASDGLDGYVARRFHQESDLGVILDPLADKLLLVSAMVLLTADTHGYFATIPVWLTATVLGRDLLVLLGVIGVRRRTGKVHLRPRLLSKAATVSQMTVVIWILLRLDQWKAEPLPWLEYAAGILTVGAGLLYLSDGLKQLREKKSLG